jgi:hypothetical protein
MGINRWFHFADPRLDDAAPRLRHFDKDPRPCLTRVCHDRPTPLLRHGGGTEMLEEFETAATFCFTPESKGVAPRHTSPPKDPMDFADFRARMTERTAPAQQQKAVA